jgi:molybdenum cofactor cytidylyltransferase
MGLPLKANGLDSRMSVGAVLLAAGAGLRLGGKPKSLLELGGVPLIMRQLIALSGAGVDEVVVVLGHHAQAIEAAIGQFPMTLVHNPSPDDGQASSVRIGLQAISPRIDAVMVALADQPLIDAQDIAAMIGAFKKRADKSMVVPRVTGMDGSAAPGNPVIFDGALREQWLAGSADLTCRNWREKYPETVYWFDTDNWHYRIDIDTPEDLERFATSTGHILTWPQALTSTRKAAA